jgi:hypothetical protein
MPEAQAPAAPAPEAIESAVRDSFRQLNLQRDLPRDEPEASPRKLNIPIEALWLLAACILALILYAFRDMIPIWRLTGRRGWEKLAGEPGEIATPSADASLAADELGRQGHFVEAMHMLLLQSLAEIRRHLGEQFADSLTSREILRGARLPAQGRTALREIVARVEWTYFGGYPATMRDYTTCRDHFEALRQALRGGASPDLRADRLADRPA